MSWRRRRAAGVAGVLGAEAGDELLGPGADLVANRADLVDSLAGRIVELPVLVRLSGVERAGVTAAHSDHDVGGLGGFRGQNLGRLVGEVNPDLSIAATAAGLIVSAGAEPAERTLM